MKLSPRRRPPAGFTLIELLVVIGMLGVLSAVAAGVYFRVKASQTIKASQVTLAKLTTGLNQQWSAERDTAEKEFKDNAQPSAITSILTMAGGDRDRAKALWMHLRLKNAFPQTFAEAKAATTLSVTIGMPASNVVASIPPRQTFVSALNGTTGAGSSTDEAAVLLYIMLNDRSSRGATFAEEAAGSLTSNRTVAGKEFKVYVDTFGTPLTYVRYATNAEINLPPFAKSNVTSKDPFDPTGRLLPPPIPGTWTTPNTTGGVSNVVATAFGFGTFSNTYWLPTIVSAGPDLDWNGLNPAAAGLQTIDDVNNDNLFGYKTRRES